MNIRIRNLTTSKNWLQSLLVLTCSSTPGPIPRPNSRLTKSIHVLFLVMHKIIFTNSSPPSLRTTTMHGRNQPSYTPQPRMLIYFLLLAPLTLPPLPPLWAAEPASLLVPVGVAGPPLRTGGGLLSTMPSPATARRHKGWPNGRVPCSAVSSPVDDYCAVDFTNSRTRCCGAKVELRKR